jgi:hypothetical protein
MKTRAIKMVAVASLLCFFVSETLATVIEGPRFNSTTRNAYFLLSQNNWTNSQAEAVTLGGRLVKVEDAAENAWIASTFDALNRNLWIGLSDAAVEGTYRWTDGTITQYRPWDPGEPNNLTGGSPTGEDFVHIWSQADPLANEPTSFPTWNDLWDTNVLRTIPIYGVVEITPLAGDANIDQSVGFADLLVVAQNYGKQTGAIWSEGDFDWNGTINFADLLIIAQAYGTSAVLGEEFLGNDAFQSDWRLARSIVPEPGMLVVLALCPAAIWRRRWTTEVRGGRGSF